MYRAKKIFLAMLVCVLLLGGAITAHASESSSTVPEHNHNFDVRTYTYYKSEYFGMHPYESNGKTVTCYVSIYYYRGERVCTFSGCNATDGYKVISEYRHSACGQ